MFKLFEEIKDAHIFFIKETKTFIGIVGIEHPTKTVFKTKDLIFYPIEYINLKINIFCLIEFLTYICKY